MSGAGCGSCRQLRALPAGESVSSAGKGLRGRICVKWCCEGSGNRAGPARGVYQKTRAHYLTHGIAMGINQIMHAETVIVIGNGAHKAAIVREAVQSPVTPQVLASVLQRHPHAYFILDQAAASLL